jgi:hypothetical protein
VVFKEHPMGRMDWRQLEHDVCWSSGPGWVDNTDKKTVLQLKKFYIVRPDKDNSESINAALRKGKNLLFTPGIYSLSEALKVTRKGTVITGLGMPSLEPLNGNSVMDISDVDGVTISGILLDAGLKRSETLMEVGEPGSPDSHKIIFWLNGNKDSEVRSIINGKGGPVNQSVRKATMK